MVRRLGFETNLYSFDVHSKSWHGSKSHVVYRLGTTGRGNFHNLGNMLQKPAAYVPLIHFISYQALIISQKDAFGLESRKSNSVVPVLF